MNGTSAPYRLHAFELSYFSAKARCALRSKGVWFEEQHANVRWILDRTGLPFIPVVETPDGEVWQDSSEIFDRLEVAHPEPALFPSTPRQGIAAHLIELYCDEFALLPAMHYRWGSARSVADARARFGAAMSPEFGARAAERMASARVALGASDDAGPAIEHHTHELLAALSAHFELHPYLLGERMSFADCSLMGPLYAHFYNDIVSRELLLETALPVVAWIERCNHPRSVDSGAWLPDDALAPTLIDVLGVMGRDAVPAVLAARERIEAWLDERSPSEALPTRSGLARGIGTASFELGGQPIESIVRPYTLWMLQRSLRAFGALGPDARQQVEAALGPAGWAALLAVPTSDRIVKDGYALAIG